MNKDISKIWIQGTSSACLVIPKKVALEYGLTDESHVVVEGTANGILIRKLEI
jgi:hypothetical protein